MKKQRLFNLFLTTLVCFVLLAAGGCTKKTVLSPQSANNANQQQGQYGISSDDGSSTMNNEGFSEDNLPATGSLDDGSYDNNGSIYDNQSEAFDQQSDQYKMVYGRCSGGLKPVFFDFDSSIIRADMVQTIQNNAKILKQIPNRYVLVEGNTDEKGTNEYNLALGERRAQNAKKYLIELGVSPQRLRTVSYGEERPLFLDTTEAAYSHNRRVDFVVE